MIAAMIAVLQRVSKASVAVRGGETSSIGKGLLVLLCAVKGDGEADVEYLAKKTAQLRIFEDEDGKMNRSVIEIGGEVLVVSQFTLAAATRKGNRPSFDAAESPERARELCYAVVRKLGDLGLTVRTGVFGAMMDVSLVNDGPVTVLLDSKE
jgi:D-tyrosyl-tRNA(Tyr) deacylase